MKTAIDHIGEKFNFDAAYFIKSGFWISLSQVFTIIFGLLTAVLLAHYLSEDDYGIYRYLLGLASILSAFSLTGLPQAILQTTAKGIFGFYYKTLKINFVYSLAICFIAIVGAAYYYWNENITLVLGCLCIAIIQPLITSTQNLPTYLQGKKLFKQSAQLQLCRVVTISSATLATLAFTHNILLIFIAALLSNATINIISNLFFNVDKEPVPKEIYERYASFAKHTSIRNSVSLIANRLDTVILFSFIDSLALAVYIVASIVPEQIKALFKNFGTLLTPKFIGYSNQQLRTVVKKRTLQLFPFLVLFTIAYILICPYLYSFLFPKYEQAIIYSQLAALAFPSFILLLPYNALQTQLSENFLYKLIFSTSIIQIVLLISSVFFFGILGAIVARILYRYIFAFATYLLFFRT